MRQNGRKLRPEVAVLEEDHVHSSAADGAPGLRGGPALDHEEGPGFDRDRRLFGHKVRFSLLARQKRAQLARIAHPKSFAKGSGILGISWHVVND